MKKFIYLFVLFIFFSFIFLKVPKTSYAQGTCGCIAGMYTCSVDNNLLNCESGYVPDCSTRGMACSGCACVPTNATCGSSGQVCCAGNICNGSPLVCIHGVCAVVCANDGDCAAGQTCSVGVCQAQPTPGPGGSGSDACGGPYLSDDIPTLGYFECLFGKIANVFLGFAGIALFIMLLSGGFKYITSSGDPKSLEAAKKIITFAIVGVILIASSYLFLVLIGTITGADVFNFTIFRE